MKTKKLMIRVDAKYQKEIFERVIKIYGGLSASSILKIPYSSLRAYKNLYFKSVPKNLIDKLVCLKIVLKEELDKKIIEVFENDKQIKKCLDFGREKRKENIIKMKEEMPSFKDIVTEDNLDFERWFSKYIFLLEAGFRKIDIKSKKNFLSLKYVNFTRHGFKEFEVRIPKKFKINSEFNYFFGLWCGDRAGGKRFGITNKNKEINKFTESFLKKNYQNVEKILTIHPDVKEPTINYDKKFVIENSKKGWVLSVHSNNGILTSFFYFLQSNLEEFLKISKHKSAFFAGLFDAEGNVSLYNKSFRWACKNERLIDIYSKFLKAMDLYDGYDGGCIISKDKEKFYNKIFPYLKHSKKINNTKFLCRGEGYLIKEFLDILRFLKESPKKTSKEISKGLKKKKSYFELKLLSDFGFIIYEDYPYKFKITQKGLKSLGD